MRYPGIGHAGGVECTRVPHPFDFHSLDQINFVAKMP